MLSIYHYFSIFIYFSPIFCRSEDYCECVTEGFPYVARSDDAHLFLFNGVCALFAANLHGLTAAEMCSGHC